MNGEKVDGGEKEAARWELVHENNAKDARDVFQLRSEFHGNASAPELFDDEEIIREGYLKPGLILRRGNNAIGYMNYKLHDVHGWPTKEVEGRVLYVMEIFIKNDERNPGIARKFIRDLRALCERLGVQYVAWAIGSDMMQDITTKVGSTFGDMENLYFMPVYELDEKALVQMMRAQSPKVDNIE
ncbi:hypothetical protein HY418_01175 [Candidatus Kaiserbacteria bacterium]|nr:hypothetical protein [Candidatus Kaiserbacteria bacterium]